MFAIDEALPPTVRSLTVRMDHGSFAGAVHEYRFPAIQPRFRSRFHGVRNLELSGGGPWRRLMARVVDRLKPLAFFDARARRHPVDGWSGDGDLRAAARFAIANDLCLHHDMCTFDGCVMEGDRPVVFRFLSTCTFGRIGELFDLRALLNDYAEYLAVAGEAGNSALHDIERELARIQRMLLSRFLDFNEVDSDGSPGGYARCGLLLGYPPETTAALILGNVLEAPGYGQGPVG
jgi:hypothetical protein